MIFPLPLVGEGGERSEPGEGEPLTPALSPLGHGEGGESGFKLGQKCLDFFVRKDFFDLAGLPEAAGAFGDER